MPPRDGGGRVALTRDALEAWTHDVRNPLAALVTNVHHLRETLAPHLDPESEEIIAECLAMFGVLERYTGNLEVLAAGDSPVAARGGRVALLDLASEVATRLQPYASVTGHRFRVLVKGALEPCVESDRLMLRPILENLASNALENAPSGPIDLVVSVRSRAAHDGERDEGCVAVLDQGPAWPTSAPGAPIDSAKRAPRSGYGRGLGLAAARLAAQAIGAKIELGIGAHGEASATLSAPLVASFGEGPAPGGSR